MSKPSELCSGEDFIDPDKGCDINTDNEDCKTVEKCIVLMCFTKTQFNLLFIKLKTAAKKSNHG